MILSLHKKQDFFVYLSIPIFFKYDKSFINDHYGHIVTGNLSIVENIKLRAFIKKGPKYREPKQLDFTDARKLITTGLLQFTQ